MSRGLGAGEKGNRAMTKGEGEQRKGERKKCKILVVSHCMQPRTVEGVRRRKTNTQTGLYIKKQAWNLYYFVIYVAEKTGIADKAKEMKLSNLTKKK